ncbi:hypothetical protein Syun_019715 [Stephania yunnanensis]|uniref:Integrase catalytic domain-containing protein n=1 Tax=Stephania yunnanensis TaxID=152371 RepID=A0AAP0IUN9_9MAGN
MCWIYFHKFKSEVAGIFWKFKQWIETQSSYQIQALRSDNGKEYTSNQFNTYCEEAGIEHQLTAPYTPQRNGVSERKNRIIMEMARCMLHEKSLPKEYWVEVAHTSVFLLNRLPTKAVDGKTPFEAWYGFKPSLKNLKVFGCLCFVYVPQIKRDKLDKKATAGIFVGYSTISKAYGVFQPHTRKILISRDVHFMENEIWDWNGEKSASNLLHNSKFQLKEDELIDDVPIRGTRSLAEIYQRCIVAVLEPADFWEAENDPKWIAAMEEELNMIEKNQTWEIVKRPADRKVIGVKWVFRTKLNANGSINKHKARLVVQGYAQIDGVDFSDTFALVARLDTIKLLLAIAAQKGWKAYQLDVKFAFLNGLLEEEIYVDQPEGFAIKGHEDEVDLLKKALYGPKQAPRAWYSRIDEHLMKLGFKKSPSEATLYIKDLGEMAYFLRMEIKQKQNEFFVCQKKYAREILKKFRMENCKEVATPMCQKEKLSKNDEAGRVDETIFRTMVGCLMYLTRN